MGGETPATVQLTFDTVRRDRQERVYIMDEKDAQVISSWIIFVPKYFTFIFLLTLTFIHVLPLMNLKEIKKLSEKLACI